MRHTLGHQSSVVHNFFKVTLQLITDQTSSSHGTDTKKVVEAGFAGLNTCAGDLLTVKFKYAKPAAGGAMNDQRIAKLMHIVLRSDHSLEIHDASVRAFD